MADRDVKFIIKAKDQASKEIKSIAEAMEVLGKNASDAADDAAATKGMFGRLGDELKKLSSQKAAFDALQRVATHMQKAGSAAQALKSEVAGLRQSLATQSDAAKKAGEDTDKLRAQLASLREVYKQQKGELEASKRGLGRESDATKNLTAAKRELAKANALSAKNPERETRIVSAQQAVKDAQAAVAANVAASEQLAVAAKATKAEIKALDQQVSASEKNFRKLSGEVTNLAAAVERSEAQVSQAEAALSEISQASAKAADKLGIVVGEEAQLAAQTKKLAPEIDKVSKALAAMQRFSRGKGQFVDPKTAQGFQKQRIEIERAEQEWKTLEGLVRSLAQEMREAGGSTDAQTQQFNELVAASRAAKKEFNDQVAALAKLQGTAKTTFAEFAKAKAPLDSTNRAIDENRQKIDQLTAAVGRYSAGNGQLADSRSADAIRKQTAEVDTARARWQLLQQEAARLAAAMRSGGSTAASLAPQFRQVSQAANLAEKEFHEAEQALRQLINAGRADIFGRFNRDTRTTLSLYQRLRGEVLALAASFVGFYGAIQNVGGVIDAYQKMEAAQNRLGVVFKQNQDITRNELTWLQRQAQRLGIEFGSLADQYSKFAVSAQAANFSQAETRKVFLSVAEAGRVNKLSLEDMNGVFLALTQMIQKGKVSSEELRQQLAERLPGAVNIFADALGVTTAELSDMLKEGEVLANSDTLIKFADELNERFGSQLPTALRSTTTLIGKFIDNLFQARLRFADGGFIESFNRALEELNRWFTSREGRDFFLSLGAAAGRVVDVLALIPRNIDLITGVVKALIATKLAMWFVDLAKSTEGGIGAARLWVASNVKITQSNSQLMASLSTLRASVATFVGSLSLADAKLRATGAATNAWATITNASAARLTAARAGAAAFAGALTGLRAALNAAAIAGRALWAAIGGLPGLIASAVAFIGAELLTSWIGGVDEATSALDRHRELMGKVIEGYEAVKGATKDWTEALKNLPLDQLEKNATDLRTQLRETTDEILSLGAGASLPRSLGGWTDTRLQVEKLRQEFKRGEKTAAEFKKSLEDIYANETNEKAKEYIRRVLELARKAEELESALNLATDAVRRKRQGIDGLNRSIEDVKGPLDDMVEATEGANKEFDEGTESVNAYQSALEGVKELIPELAEEMKKMKDLAKLDALVDGLGFGPLTQEMQQFVDRARQSIMDKSRNFEAEFTSGRGTATGQQLETLVREVTKLAEKMGLSAKDLLTAMSFETGGTFNPAIRGGKNNRHVGLIQFGDAAQQRYGVNQMSSIAEQVKATGAYLADAGVKAGDGLLQIYAAINSGSARKIHASDTANGGTPGTVLDKVTGQMEGHEARAAGLLKAYAGIAEHSKEIAKNEKEAEETRKKQEESTKTRLQDNQFEIEQQTLKNAGKEREAAIEAAIREAKKENPNIGTKELEQIEKQAAALFDKQKELSKEEQTKKRIAELDQNINNLETQRNALLEQRRFYEEQGNTEKIEETNAALAGVNSQLTAAIDKSIAFHQALGGDKAAATIAQLNSMKLAIAQSNMEGQRFAMTAGEMSNQIFQSLEGGVISGFHALAQAIANGENAVDSLKTAFRQWAADFLIQIAEMIIKQTLFNALQGFSKALGGGLFNFASFHTGGIAGQSGGATRAVSPLWFTNAIRYHSGGIAGLKPGEVPAVLKEGEEILTETNPRHINNQGKGGSASPTNIKVVNTFDPASYLTEALNSAVGEEVLLNFVRANPGAFKSALEG